MKYLLRVIIVLLVAAGVVFGYSSYYREQKNNENIVLTTQRFVTTAQGETTESSKKLVAEVEGADYQLYIDTEQEAGYLVHDGVETEIGGWGWMLLQTPIEAHYGDYDNDGENEILILYQSDSDEVNSNLIVADQGDFSQCYRHLAIVNIYTDESGNEKYSVAYSDQDTWKTVFENAISSQMNQLLSCDKYMQFVMDDSDVNLTYDENTGISQNKYVYYARALKNTKSDGYQKLLKWSKGQGSYSVNDDDTITLEIMVLAYYEEDADRAQYIGDIRTQISVNESGKFSVTPKTIDFVANSKYYASDPREDSVEDFSVVVNNSGDRTTTTTDNYIDWLETDFTVSQTINEQTYSFSDLSSQIKCIEKIEFTPDGITMTAKEGFEFAQRVIDNGEYSVTVQIDDDTQYDIAYSAAISQSGSKSVLKINFDKPYSREEIEQLNIVFGS